MFHVCLDVFMVLEFILMSMVSFRLSMLFVS